VPVVYSDLNLPENDSETGLGDILLRGAFRAARGERYAVVAAAEFILDTASDPNLGLGKNRFGPLVFASIEVPSLRSRFFPFYQHVFSFAGDENRPDINYASIRPSVILTKWPNRWYTVIDPNFFVDFERENKSGMTLELEVGRPVKKNVNVWVRPGMGVYGDIPQVYDWNLSYKRKIHKRGILILRRFKYADDDCTYLMELCDCDPIRNVGNGQKEWEGFLILQVALYRKRPALGLYDAS
jgi:hypothetical protein